MLNKARRFYVDFTAVLVVNKTEQSGTNKKTFQTIVSTRTTFSCSLVDKLVSYSYCRKLSCIKLDP